MFGYIILRDIPKKLVQLDLIYFPIKGGFRGFAEVSPGPHYVSIEVNEEMHEGFWCWVNTGEAIIKVYIKLKLTIASTQSLTLWVKTKEQHRPS